MRNVTEEHEIMETVMEWSEKEQKEVEVTRPKRFKIGNKRDKWVTHG